ncbi:MAG: M15 family metallopeptidase, partial [Microbacterium sp.]|uniref:M15 family metallopeptidase n=1 Tax=Microbacterium sp. TaxID=51671 RepID=UPI0039E71610
EPLAQHAARPRTGARIGALTGVAAAVLAATVAVTSAVAGAPEPQPVEAAVVAPSALPEIKVEVVGEESSDAISTLSSSDAAGTLTVPLCARPKIVKALKKHNDRAVIAAFGGAAKMRAAVAAGKAPCVRLDDPTRIWVVVDKANPYTPRRYEPDDLARVSGIRVLNAGILRKDAGAALTALVDGASAAGAGELAITSGYRSFADQRRQYRSQVSALGRTEADKVSARPGYSEHQSGLAADLVACDAACSSIEHLGDTPQGEWLADNAWRYGFIVRYEKGQTKTTGYSPEPWHIRYIGKQLAKAYHKGGFHTLEEFWGLSPAPSYGD